MLAGAFVAGLDAGLVYNSFPKMADKWIPDDILALAPKISNFTENPTTVQFDHRILGTTTLMLINILWLRSRKLLLPHRAHVAVNTLMVLSWLQVSSVVFVERTNAFHHHPMEIPGSQPEP